MTQFNKSQVDEILRMKRLGWYLIDIPQKMKSPNSEGWQGKRYTAEQLATLFNTPKNIGLLLGLEPVPILDVDLDAPEAVRIAGSYLPATPARFGRNSKGVGHYLYEVLDPKENPIPKSRTWKIAGQILIELRSTGQQTVIPGSIHPSSEPILWSSGGPEPIPTKQHPDDLIAIMDKIAAITALAQVWPIENGRHFATLAFAGGMARSGILEEETVDIIQQICRLVRDEDELGNGDRTRSVADTYQKWRSGEQKLAGWIRLKEILQNDPALAMIRRWLHLDSHALTSGTPAMNDVGNAYRFKSLHLSAVRYNVNTGGWLAWEGTRWHDERNHVVEHLAEDVHKQIEMDAAESPSEHERRELQKFAKETGNTNRINSLVARLRADPEMSVYNVQLDTDASDINLLSGTYNLDRFEHRPHNPEDLITKLAPVRWDPYVKPDERWEAFLDDVTDCDPEFRRYLQKAAGYSLTGHTQEDVFFFAHGPAASGKTTFLETLLSVMGDYATTLNPESMLIGAKVGAGNARPDLAKLIGVRFVKCSEMDEGRAFNTIILKQWTGGDMVTARQLYGKEFSFRPIAKFWFATNYDPSIRASDTGMWRRIHVLDFDHPVPESRRDLTLRDYLTDTMVTGPAILKWMIDGYRMYKEDGGLQKPEVVTKAIASYREANDHFRDFFDDHVVFDPAAEDYAKEISESYEKWCRDTGVRSASPTAFAQRLRVEGCSQSRKRKDGKVVRAWKGLRLITHNEMFESRFGVVKVEEDAVVA